MSSRRASGRRDSRRRSPKDLARRKRAVWNARRIVMTAATSPIAIDGTHRNAGQHPGDRRAMPTRVHQRTRRSRSGNPSQNRGPGVHQSTKVPSGDRGSQPARSPRWQNKEAETLDATRVTWILDLRKSESKLDRIRRLLGRRISGIHVIDRSQGITRSGCCRWNSKSRRPVNSPTNSDAPSTRPAT